VSRRVLRNPITWGIAAALLVVVPQLRFAQFSADDYTHLAVLEGIEIHRGMGPLNLYSFFNGDPDLMAERISVGPTAWTADPSQTIKFFRPLSSALLTLNHEIAGLDPLGYAIHGLLWYVVVIVLVSGLVLRVFPEPRGARFHPAVYLVMVMFALSSSNCSTVLWSAAQWILVSTSLGLAALIAHLKWREQGWTPGLYLSLIAMSAALLAGEAALALLAFLAAYELFGSSDPLKKRVIALTPATLLVLVYVAYYKAMGHGSTGLAAYRDPLENPAAYFTALPSKMLAMSGELFLGVQSSAWFFPGQRTRTVLSGVAAVVLVGTLLYPIWKRSPRRQRRRIVWMITGILGSLFPLASRMPNPHILLAPLVGSTVLVGFILNYSWRYAKRRPSLLNVLRLLAGLAFVYLLVIRPPLAWLAFGQQWQSRHERLEQFHSQPILKDLRPHQRAVFLNFRSWDLEFHGYYYRKVHDLPMPEAWWHLSRSSLQHRYHRTAPDTLEMEVIGGSLGVPTTTGGDSRFDKGDGHQLPGLRITILDAHQGGVTRVEFRFDRPLTDDTYRFMAWRDNSLESVDLPPVGESLLVNSDL
jgi:hypothetical protein